MGPLVVRSIAVPRCSFFARAPRLSDGLGLVLRTLLSPDRDRSTSRMLESTWAGHCDEDRHKFAFGGRVSECNRVFAPKGRCMVQLGGVREVSDGSCSKREERVNEAKVLGKASSVTKAEQRVEVHVGRSRKAQQQPPTLSRSPCRPGLLLPLPMSAKLNLLPLPTRLSARSPYEIPEPGFSGSSAPDSIDSKIERAASRKGDSTFSPVREDVSRNRAPGRYR